MCVSITAVYKCVYVCMCGGVTSLKEVHPLLSVPRSCSPSLLLLFRLFSLSLPAIPLLATLLMFPQSGLTPAAMSPERQPPHTNEELRGGEGLNLLCLAGNAPSTSFPLHISSSFSSSSLWKNREISGGW